MVSVQTVQMLPYQLFAEANKPHRRPVPSSGVSFKLCSRHRQLLESRPAPQPQRESVMAARQAAFRAFFTEAPGIATRTMCRVRMILNEASAPTSTTTVQDSPNLFDSSTTKSNRRHGCRSRSPHARPLTAEPHLWQLRTYEQSGGLRMR